MQHYKNLTQNAKYIAKIEITLIRHYCVQFAVKLLMTFVKNGLRVTLNCKKPLPKSKRIHFQTRLNAENYK